MQVNDRAKQAFQYLLSRGLSPQAAAGAVGNFAVESGNFADDVLSGQRRGDNGSAWYMQQLRGSRLNNYRDFTSANNLDPHALESQLDFFLEETNAQSPYADMIAAKNSQKFFDADTPHDAAMGVMNHYERASSDPSLNHGSLRSSYAANLLGQAGQQGLSYDRPQSSQQNTNYYSTNVPSGTSDAAPPFPSFEQSNSLAVMSGPKMSGAAAMFQGFKRHEASFGPEGADDADQRANPTSLRPAMTGTTLPQPPNDGSAQASGLLRSSYGPVASREGVDIDGMLPQTRDALSMAASYLGRDIPINSAFRSQDRQNSIRMSGDPNRITVAKDSQHTHGTAVDIPIKDMTDEEIAALADSLAGSGFTAFGYYGRDGHLHADMRSAVPKSFNPDTGWGGWTNLPPFIMQSLIRRGFRPGASSSDLTLGFGDS